MEPAWPQYSGFYCVLGEKTTHDSSTELGLCLGPAMPLLPGPGLKVTVGKGRRVSGGPDLRLFAGATGKQGVLMLHFFIHLFVSLFSSGRRLFWERHV